MKIDRHKLANVIRSLDGVDDEVKSQLLGLLNKKESFGLKWDEKSEDAEEQMCDQLPVLQEVTSRRILSDDPTAPNHVLIEGDNLHALTSLCYTHEGEIDVIYIDPPYNTGNKDFIYNDSYVDAEDGYRHSKWLSFMKRRLTIAKRLLSDKGVIFISIDDNEQAYLKLLCDDIFEEKNFIANLIWQKKFSRSNDALYFSTMHDHILCYSKYNIQDNINGWKIGLLDREGDIPKGYANPDNDPRGVWTSTIMSAKSGSSSLLYDITTPGGRIVSPPSGRFWSCSKDTFLQWESEGRIWFGKDGNGSPRKKTFLSEVQNGLRPNTLILQTEGGNNQEGKQELKALFNGEGLFDSPKPTKLINLLLRIANTKNGKILDFFAGSGTTLHATMQLNAEDGGHRKCILVTNNENGICENVTYERNKRVIEGYTTPKGEHVEGLKANNLRYYKTEFVDRERTSRNMRALMKMATDMLCIKEDLYDEVEGFGQLPQKDGIYRHFRKEGKQMLVIYKEDYIEDFIAEIEKMEVTQRIHVYVFSPSNDPFTEVFDEVADKVKLVALPAAIYEAYKEVLPQKKETLLPEFESQEQTKDEEEKEVTLDNLFD